MTYMMPAQAGAQLLSLIVFAAAARWCGALAQEPHPRRRA
jgi:hypothetical protein